MESPFTVQSVKALIFRKDEIEKEIQELESLLGGPGGPGLRGGLIDAEGYPRADIDIPKIREQRHRLACTSQL